MRFGRKDRALVQLADALRRAEMRWRLNEVANWDDVRESEREEWRSLARVAASSVYEELYPARDRAAVE